MTVCVCVCVCVCESDAWLTKFSVMTLGGRKFYFTRAATIRQVLRSIYK
jgi:hypothetical protein